MTKLLVFPSSKKQIENISHLVDGFIIGINNLCVNCPLSVSTDELEELLNLNKEIFICLNKNIFNSDLSLLEETLKKINNMKVAGIFYYDVSVLSLSRKLNLNIPLVWSQEHLTTNYLTCEYYHEKDVKYVYLSAEITLNEIIEINSKTNLECIVPIFGYLPMFNSKRHIVDNYLKTFNLEKKDELNYIEKENKLYPIIDEELGTIVFDDNILNGLEELLVLKEKGISYVTLNSFNISDDDFLKVLNIYNSVTNENKEELSKELNNMFSNIDKGFLYKETIYRVKKDGKM